MKKISKVLLTAWTIAAHAEVTEYIGPQQLTYSSVQDNIGLVVQTVRSDKLDEATIMLELTICNDSQTRYRLLERAIGLNNASYAQITKLTQSLHYLFLAGCETLLHAADALAIIGIYKYGSMILKKRRTPFSLDAGIAIPVLALLCVGRTVKDRLVALLREHERHELDEHEKKKTFFDAHTWTDHGIIEPGQIATKWLLVRRADFRPTFPVVLTSHDYTAQPHNVEFIVNLAPLD